LNPYNAVTSPVTTAITHTHHRHQPFPPPDELPQPVTRARWPRLHRLGPQVPPDVRRERARALVAPSARLLDRLHHDPVQLPFERSPQRRRPYAPDPPRRAHGAPRARRPRLFLRYLHRRCVGCARLRPPRRGRPRRLHHFEHPRARFRRLHFADDPHH